MQLVVQNWIQVYICCLINAMQRGITSSRILINSVQDADAIFFLQDTLLAHVEHIAKQDPSLFHQSCYGRCSALAESFSSSQVQQFAFFLVVF